MFMKRNANWARIVVAIFTMAVFYASVCATTCSIGFCPNQVQQTTGHDCEQAGTHHSGPAGHEPANSDCSPHQHPGPFLAKSAELPQFQLSFVSQLDVSATVSEAHQLVFSMADADAADLAPPVKSSSALYQSISVLRI
jgi:hypothetical protein